MAFIDFDTILTRLNDLTTKINAIYTNSKKIFELPNATIGQKLVAVWNATDLTTQKFDLTQALDNINQLNDRITSIGTITRDVDTFEFSVGFEWIIGGLNYQNASIVELTPVASTDDYYRIDIAVLDTNNDIVLVQGFESLTIAEQPQTPPNTLFLCSFSIFGASVGTPTTPIVGSDYLKKIYQNEVNSSSIPNITLPSTGQTSFNFSTGGFNIEGFDGSSELFDGKIFVLKNSSDTTINLVQNGTSTIKFKFITATDYDLIANEIITLRYSEVRGLEILGSNKSIASTPTLQLVLDENPIASFTATSSGSIMQIEEVVNNFSDFYSQKSITSADNNTQAVESLGEFQSIRQANVSNATYQTINQDVVGVIVETEGLMNTIRTFSKEIISSGHTGGITVQVPTPKTGAGGVNVNIEFPYKEVSGTYRVATQDEIPSITGFATEVYADAKVENNLTESTSVAPSKTAVNTALGLKADLEVEETIATSGTTNLDFSFDSFAKITQTGSIVIDGINTSGTKKISKTFLLQGSTNPAHTISFPNTWKNLSGVSADSTKMNFIEVNLINGSIVYSINKYAIPDVTNPTLLKSSILLESLNTIELLYSEAIDSSVTTQTSWYSVTGKTVSSVTILSNKVRIVVSVPFTETDTPLVTFTNQVSGNGIQDAGGNKAPDFSQTIGLTTYRFDNFNRVNSTTSVNSPSDAGSDWVTPFGAVWGINTNKAYCFGANTTTAQANAMYLESNESNVTLRGKFTLGTSGVTSSTSFVTRYIDASNYYLCQFGKLSTGQLFYSINKVVAGVSTTIVANTNFGTWVNGTEYTFMIKFNGSTLTLYNGTTSLVQVVDSSVVGTKHGLRLYSGSGSSGNTDRFDDFGVYYG